MNKHLIHNSISTEQLEAYLDGTLNEKETQEIDTILDKSPKLQWVVDEYVRHQMESHNEDMQHSKTHIRPHTTYFRYVAATTAFILISGAFYMFFRESNKTSMMQTSIHLVPCSLRNTYIAPIDSIQPNDSTSCIK